MKKVLFISVIVFASLFSSNAFSASQSNNLGEVTNRNSTTKDIMQIKVWSSHDLSLIEKNVNKWLEERAKSNSSLVIVAILQSQSGASSRSSYENYTMTIVYYEKTVPVVAEVEKR